VNKGGHVYIMADRYRGTIYIGVTAHLSARIMQHRTGDGSDFCKRYGLERLVTSNTMKTSATPSPAKRR